MASHQNRGHVSVYKRFKPHIVMILAQILICGVYIIAQASTDHGMNPHVYVTYRQIVAGVVLFPFAYILERKLRPRLTIALFQEIFILSLIGACMPINLMFASLKYTSSTFVTCMINSIACLIFVIAVALRLEILDTRNHRGVAKVLGTLLSLGGVLIMTLYQGPSFRTLVHPPVHLQGKKSIHENWLEGSLLCIGGCITWSVSGIMQAYTLKRYPAPLSLTTWMCIIGGAQSAVFTVCVEHKLAAWTIGFNIDFWSTIYGGVVGSGIVLFLQLWATEERGPVFVAIFDPFGTFLVAVISYFVLGENLYVGSLIGGAIVILGLYLLLWGKEEENRLKLKENLTTDKANAPNPLECSQSHGKEATKEEP